MPWIPSDKEIAAIFQLDARKRYSYWIKKVADEETVWGLWKESGWAMMGDDEGRELFPVWPHSRFASACAQGTLAGFTPKEISLSVWMSRWIPGLLRDKRLVAVFPTPSASAVVLSPEMIDSDIHNEMSKYE